MRRFRKTVSVEAEVTSGSCFVTKVLTGYAVSTVWQLCIETC